MNKVEGIFKGIQYWKEKETCKGKTNKSIFQKQKYVRYSNGQQDWGSILEQRAVRHRRIYWPAFKK